MYIDPILGKYLISVASALTAGKLREFVPIKNLHGEFVLAFKLAMQDAFPNTSIRRSFTRRIGDKISDIRYFPNIDATKLTNEELLFARAFRDRLMQSNYWRYIQLTYFEKIEGELKGINSKFDELILLLQGTRNDKSPSLIGDDFDQFDETIRLQSDYFLLDNWGKYFKQELHKRSENKRSYLNSKVYDFFVDPYIKIGNAKNYPIKASKYLDLILNNSSDYHFQNNIIFIEGEPGVGKSTIIDNWTAQLAKKKKKYIRINLKDIVFRIDSQKKLIEAVNETIYPFHISSLIELFGLEQCILFFDGLDEFNADSKDHLQCILDLISSINSTIVNNGRIGYKNLKVVFLGRPIIIERTKGNSPSNGRICPLVISNIKHNDEDNTYHIDLRRKFASALNISEVSQLGKFILCENEAAQYDLTLYPLTLIILHSLFSKRNATDYSKLTSKFLLYTKIFQEYHDRECNLKKIKIEYHRFYKGVENLAFSAWHFGNVRRIRYDLVKSRNYKIGYFLHHYINKLNREDFSYLEFTHKSFGEYHLTNYFKRNVYEHFANPNETVKNGIVQMYKLFSSHPIDHDVILLYREAYKQEEKAQIQLKFLQFFKEIINSVTHKMDIIYKPILNLKGEKSIANFDSKIGNMIIGCLITANIVLEQKNWKAAFVEIPLPNTFYQKVFSQWILPKPDSYQVIKHLRLTDTVLEYIDFRRIKNLEGVDFSNTSLRHCNLTNVNLSNSLLRGTNLSYVDLTDAILEEVNLEKAVFTNATLDKVDFNGARNIDITNLAKCKSIKEAVNIDHDLIVRILRERKADNDFLKQIKYIRNVHSAFLTNS